MAAALHINDSTINGPVVGVNNGNIAFTMYSGPVGTVIQHAAPALIQRLPGNPSPPLPPRGFRDREVQRAAIQAELRMDGRVWLHGCGGCGASALLAVVAQSATLKDGVAWVAGAHAGHFHDDVLMYLFQRFYLAQAGAEHAIVDPATACTYLQQLQAVFVLDDLPLARSDLDDVVNDLNHGVVLVAADAPAHEACAPCELGGLPPADAVAMWREQAGLASGRPPLQVELRLCAALGHLPLPLRLVGRVMRAGVLTLEGCMALLDTMTGKPLQGRLPADLPRSLRLTSLPEMSRQDDALVRAVWLCLAPLDASDHQILAFLARAAAPDLDLATLAQLSQIPSAMITPALTRLRSVGLVVSQAERWSIPASRSLRHAIDQLLPAGDEQRRAAAFFARAALAHVGNMPWLQQEQGNVLAAIRTQLANGELRQVGQVIQAVQPAVASQGQWGSWKQLLDWARTVASTTNDRSLEAWALHEEGTRLGLVGERTAAVDQLRRAEKLRRRLGDRTGAAASRHNRLVLQPGAGWWKPTRRKGLIAAVVLLAGTLVSLFLALGGSAANSSTATATATATSTSIPGPTTTPVVMPPPPLPSPSGTATPTATFRPTATPSATPPLRKTATTIPTRTKTVTSTSTITPTETVTATTTITPPAPQRLAFTVDQRDPTRSSVILTWLPVQDPNGIQQYILELAPRVSSSISNNSAPIQGQAPAPSFEFLRCCPPGSSWLWHVRAVDKAGTAGPWSSVATIVMPPLPTATSTPTSSPPVLR
ncbi:MAG: fibronectin type III domain-containing protein [Herpetosiphonaceae bacterium]|nr:fibronectin type III domain-containing protein [Herpetosiphonaceae bacterium]